MAKKRTKKQKIAVAKKKRSTTEFNLGEVTQQKISKKDTQQKQIKKLLLNDPKDVLLDLRKTLIVSLVVLFILGSIFIWKLL